MLKLFKNITEEARLKMSRSAGKIEVLTPEEERERMDAISGHKTLYTSGDGQTRCRNGEVFLASTKPNRNNHLRFRVSQNYVFGNGHNVDFLVVDTGNDVVFEADE